MKIVRPGEQPEIPELDSEPLPRSKRTRAPRSISEILPYPERRKEYLRRTGRLETLKREYENDP